MNQNQTNPETDQPIPLDNTHPVTWTGAVLLGIGLWMLNGGSLTAPSLMLWLGAILILVGGSTLLLKGYWSFIRINKFPTFLIIPLSVGIGISVVLVLGEHAVRYLSFPYPLDDGEGFCLNQALRLAQGQALYPPIDSPPYIVTNYPPVFPAILSIFINPENINFFSGRLLSVFSTIILCLAAAGCVRSVTGNSHAGWIAGLLVAASPILFFWGALLRVDVLASMLGLIALWIGVSAKGPRVLWSLPFLIAAIYTRQSSVEALIAITVGLFLNSVPKKENPGESRANGFILVAGWIIGVILVLIILQIWTGGEFWHHTVTYTRTRFYPSRILSDFEWVLPAHVLLFIIALFALPRALTDKRRRMLGIFFIASFATSLLSGKVGSDLNYFLNLVVGSAILTGLFTSDLLAATRSIAGRSKLIIPAMLLIPAALVQSGLMEGHRSFSFTPRYEDHLAGAHIVSTLSSPNGPILSEDEGFCLLSGHEVLFNPFIMSALAREGTWDETHFIEAIENKEFDLIMLRFHVDNPNHDDKPGVGCNAGWDRFTPAMEEAISGNYELDSAVSPVFMRRYWYIYRPVSESPNMINTSTDVTNLIGGGE